VLHIGLIGKPPLKEFHVCTEVESLDHTLHDDFPVSEHVVVEVPEVVLVLRWL
jgi:hypothetical protein